MFLLTGLHCGIVAYLSQLTNEVMGMILKKTEGLWYAKQAVLPNIICIGFGPERDEAMKHCWELVAKRRGSSGFNDKTQKAQP